MNLCPTRLKELLAYDPESGVFTWRVNISNRKAGAPAGAARPDGYLQIGVDGTLYLAHRLAWFYVHGEWPKPEVDHKNRIKTDNRLDNLRVATRYSNLQNIKLRGAFPGAKRLKNGRFVSRIKVNGRQIHLGTFDTPHEASAAYFAAKELWHVSTHGPLA